MDQIKNLLGKVICEGEASIKDLAEKNKAYLRDADLSGAVLTGADLRGAWLEGARLEGARLRDADLRGAWLQDANLRRADLWGANLPKSIMEAKWGVPANSCTTFLLLSLKIPLNPEIAQAMLLNRNFCWGEAKGLFGKSPKLAKALKKEWPELYEELAKEEPW